MRAKLACWVIAYSALCLPCSAQQKTTDASSVLSLEKKWTDAYKHRQIEMLSSILADDFVITVENGDTFGKEGYITHTADASVHVEMAEQSDIRVRMHGNTAILTGAYHEKGTSKGKDYEYHDRFTDVWMRSEGKWQVIASHYSIPVN